MKWLDKVPLSLILLAAIFLAVAPVFPEPHLIEKTRMLLKGTLIRPIDIFDLFWHAAPQVLLLLKLYIMVKQQAKRKDSGKG